MRVADVGWNTYTREGDKYSDLVIDGGPCRLFEYAGDNARAMGAAYVIWKGRGEGVLFKTNSMLELACFLADKEPCEPTSSSASSSTT